MSYFYLRPPVPNLPLNFTSNTLWPLFTNMVDGARLQPTIIHSNYKVSFMKNISCSSTFINTFPRLHSSGTLQISVSLGKSSENKQVLQPQSSTNSLQDHTGNEKIHFINCSNSSQSSDEDHKEIQRRKKIGLANKGKTPWNKGRKHSAETRERIKQRTIEALRDPKVKKKMSGRPRAHSNLSKARIGLAQRKIWRDRLKKKRLREKVFLKWADSIAEAAKKGGNEELELDWDSYAKINEESGFQLQCATRKAKVNKLKVRERIYLKWADRIAEAAKIGGNGQQELYWESYIKIKEEIAFRELQRATDEAKAKEITKVRSEIAARVKAERKERRVEKRKEKEKKEIGGEETKRNAQRRRNGKEETGTLKGLKLNASLTKVEKVHTQDPINGQVDMAFYQNPVIETWDLEFVRREKLRRKVSLADQIREAKIKRAESATKEKTLPRESYSSNGTLRRLLSL